MSTSSRTTSTSIRILPLWAWWTVIVYMHTVIITYIFSLPVHYSRLLGNPALSPALATSQLIIDYVLIIITVAIGTFLVFKRHNEWIAVLMGVTIMVALPNIPGISYWSTQLHPLFHIPAGLAMVGTPALGFLTLISMPDGYPRPRKLAWLVGFMLIYDTIRYILLFVFPPDNAPTLRAFTTMPSYMWVLLASYFMVRRYRRVATPTQRQQFKWLFWGLAIEVIIIVCNQIFLLFMIITNGNVDFSNFLINVTNTIGGVILCVALVFAISRYGLWDVDLTINRSVVAGVVTISLMILFAGIFALSQTALRMILGEGRNEIAITLSALMVGIAFNPVRHRVRTFVDRRLYGFRFDLNQLRRHKSLADVHIPGALTGQKLGGYELTMVIGRGNMGEVYRGVANNKVVAVKIMQTTHAHDDKHLHQRFEREGKIVLKHPNIVQTLGAGEENGIFYILMEYVEGISLKELLIEREHLPFATIIPYLTDLANAIDYAHAQGYIHRDIKPSNIMFRRGGTNQPRGIMLMDFGIAKFLGDTGTLTGSAAVGTIDYMAPEQIMDSTTVDHRADIYALGVVLYETLSGVLPFQGGLAQILFAHVNQPAPSIRTIRPDIPLHIANAIQRAMQKDPNDRFQTATEFVQAVNNPL
ncbi:MAG: serine/threonine protein kinase [Anaerolineae bacterium]|nr:serine/threonine protein kinase [Anaerolineae bacterium]